MTLLDILLASLDGLLMLLGWREIACLIAGVLMGSIVGILPGLGGAAALAFLLPFVLTLEASQAFALLMGVAAVTATTGDLTSILLGVPGEPTSAATVLDGHAMARRGEALRAVGVALYSSLFGAIFGALLLAALLPAGRVLIRAVASPELFMLAILGIAFVMPLAGVSRVKGAAAGGIGILLATVGADPLSGTVRYTFGQLDLWDGVAMVPVVLGLFAIPEIAGLMSARGAHEAASSVTGGSLRAGVVDVLEHWKLVLKSSAIGSAMGMVPGVGASVSQWMAYAAAARRSTGGTQFGTGVVEGVIAPAAANNATLGGSLVPTLVLGVPGSLTSAMLLTALIMKGLTPGPELLAPRGMGGQLPLLFFLVWLLVAGNVLAVILASLSSGVLVRIASVRENRLIPFLLIFAIVGAFGERQTFFDVIVMTIAGGVGMLFVRYDWPRAPVLLGLLLGGLAENRLFLSLQAYGLTWLTRPGVMVIGGLLLAVLCTPLGNSFRRRRSSNFLRTDRESRICHADELVFEFVLIAILLVAFVVAGTYGARASLMPRLVSAVTAVLLLIAFVGDFRSWLHQSTTPTSHIIPGSLLRWVPLFLALAWVFGFSVGLSTAALAYLFATGERPMTAAALAAGAWILLDVVLDRLLGMSFPVGAFTVWSFPIPLEVTW